jgi:hypothetical protein
MQQNQTNHKKKFTTNSDFTGQPVMQDKSNKYRHETNHEHLSSSLSAPVKAHQPFIQRQQYYTGDA